MESNNQHLGPALAIVIIIGVVAISGIYFYKHMVKDITSDTPDAIYSHDHPDDHHGHSQGDEDIRTPALPELSTSTDITEIEADLETSLVEEFLADLDEELLDFEELESLDFIGPDDEELEL